MTLKITLPDDLAEQLQRKAAEKQSTAEASAIDLLGEALEADF
jgi:plasmid stability protein